MTRKEFDKGYRLLVHWCKENDIWIRIKDDLFTRQNRSLDKFFDNMNGRNTYNGYTQVCDWFDFVNYKSSLGSICSNTDEVQWLNDNFFSKWREWAIDHANFFE